MAPSSGHLLVPKALKAVQYGFLSLVAFNQYLTDGLMRRFAISKTTALIRSTTNARANASLQPVRVYARNQPLHPLAFLRQSRSQQDRWYTAQTRTFSSTRTKAHDGLKPNRFKLPVSRTARVISQRGAAPFATTLRPNLTGGALPRTAGGYSVGGAGNARHFSHTSGCQAQVLHNVNAGIRAFLVGGGKARYDGIDPMNGEKRFRAISNSQERVYKQLEGRGSSTKGTNLEFHISPTVTAFAPSSVDSTSINLQTPNLLTNLSSDFARSLRSLSLVLNDLKRLSTFGDLPISLTHTPNGPILIVRFLGCDAALVSRLCDEVGITRGVVKEDEAWDYTDGDKDVQMALLFPLAPTKDTLGNIESDLSGDDYFGKPNPLEQEVRQEQLYWRNMYSSSKRSIHSDDSEMSFGEATQRSPIFRASSPSGYESLEGSYDWTPSSQQSSLCDPSKTVSGSQEFEGLEGIYRFLQVCEDSRR